LGSKSLKIDELPISGFFIARMMRGLVLHGQKEHAFFLQRVLHVINNQKKVYIKVGKVSGFESQSKIGQNAFFNTKTLLCLVDLVNYMSKFD
jgi:hypothetical protein